MRLTPMEPRRWTTNGGRRFSPRVRLLVAVALSTAVASGAALAQSRYQVPPKAVVDILDARPLPTVALSPSRQAIALLERAGMPTIADLSQPMLRLAGIRINPRTNGPHRPPALTGITLTTIADGKAVRVAVPPGARLDWIGFSPDSRKVAFTETKAAGITLWVADAATGAAKPALSVALNATIAQPCGWVNAASLLCRTVPAARKATPRPQAAPTGPNIQENEGRAAPVSTYEDLLKNAHDDALFEHYFTSQLALVNAATGAARPVGPPGIMATASTSPNGDYILVVRLKKPYSRLVPYGDFARTAEVWSSAGKLMRVVADLPSNETVPMAGVPEGPRDFTWNPVEPATLVWAEALDGGDLRKPAPQRDRLCVLQSPFDGPPSEWLKFEHRYQSIAWTSADIAVVTEFEREKRTRRIWFIEKGVARRAWQVSAEDRYKDPGRPVVKPRFGGGPGVIMQVGDTIFLEGDGASPQGDRPFLDRLNARTLDTERIFQCEGESYESVVGVLADNGRTLLTRHETTKQPPNYVVRDLTSRSERRLTQFRDPAPQLAGVQREFITYVRNDGVKLGGTLYLPPGYQKGQRLPLVMWAYPREFTDPALAGQVSGSPYRFTTYSGASHLFFLTQGYAVLDDPSMPIVGPGETANDTYVNQLVASAQAAIDKVVEMGVADRDRIGVGGHSYGAFMTANLLAHSRLFRAGIARSGAYNRTLTPFGFQSERRTFWEIPDIYAKMSPFWYANEVKDPILLIHGEADDNSGTFPIQSERFYMALKGHGATVRYVTLPDEAHGYSARESVLHTLYEMIGWFDKYVKNASARQ
jgi:dipeptidyl aminopeptidase/acylaminoacyl peptidase